MLVVFGDPSIKVGLQLVDGAIDLLAEGDAVKLVQDGAMEALAAAVGLRALGFCPAVVDVLNHEIELIFMARCRHRRHPGRRNSRGIRFRTRHAG